MSIVVTNLLKTYGPQKAVNNISFSIQEGEIAGFLGPNGAGKSTTMKMLTGYLKPDAGFASIAGLNVAQEPLKAKRKIGYLPEANPLYFDMYVKEYLEFIAGIHGISDKRKRISNIIELTGLTIESKKRIGQPSKGYKQRVGLAAALIHQPSVLILDEPTSGLDPNQIIEIRNVIRSQGQNKTILFSSHILQEVQAICDRVIIINKGELVADDTLSNLQQKGNSNIVKVTFKEALQSELIKGLAAVKSVNKLDAYSWHISSDDTNELKKQLLELTLQHNLNMVSLQTEGGSLEEIFRNLTVAEKA